jgi:glutamyl-tRNA synthetase
MVPVQALHTAAAALSLVPLAHWTIETHRANINSYDGSDAVIIPSENAGAVVPDKIFKKELYHYLRWALSASAPGPGIPEIMTILGREETLRRIQDAKALTQSLVPQTGRRVPKASGEKKLQEDKSWMGTLAPQK